MSPASLTSLVAFVAVVACAAVVVPAPPVLADAATEPPGRITEYRTEAVVHPDGAVDVTETITFDFGSHEYAGIEHAFPVLVDSDRFREHLAEVADLAVTSPTGADTTIGDTYRRDGNLHVPIGGGEGRPVTGEQTYEFSYTVENAVTASAGGAEFSWALVGHGWAATKADVSVRLSAPEIQDVACTTENDLGVRDCEGLRSTDTVVEVEPGDMSYLEGLTLTATLPDGTVSVAEPVYTVRSAWTRSPTSDRFAVVVGVVLAAMVLYRLVSWWRAGPGGSRAARGLSVGAAGLLRRGLRAPTPLLLLAMMTDLWARGLVHVERTADADGDWTFVRDVSPQDPDLTPAESALVDQFFYWGRRTGLDKFSSIPRPMLMARLRDTLHTELLVHGLAWPRWGSALVKGAVPLGASAVGLWWLSQGDDGAGFSGSGLAAVLLLAYAAGSVLLLGVRPISGRGRVVRRRLRRVYRDTLDYGPLSVKGSPGWEVVFDFPRTIVESWAREPGEDTTESAPFHRDTGYRARWSWRLAKEPRSITPGPFY